MSNEIVVKSNHLVEASYKITLNEQRLVLCAISKIDSQGKIPERVVITAQDWLKMFPDIGEQHVHQKLQKTVMKLWERTITVADPSQTNFFRWLSNLSIYHQGTGQVSFVFSEEIKKYLSQLNDFFTKYPVKEISTLKSVYSIRLYELIKQFETLQTRKISLAKFRDFFQLGNKYSQFKALRKWVITPAIKELNKKSPLVIGVDFERHLRKIAYLQFNWQEKPQ